ncbi:MAG: alanine--tRNA ligase, partial [Methanobacteriota archaeon]
MKNFRREELLDDAQFSARIFDELGFVHRLCPKCKTGFWTLDSERVLCGEPPCEEYTFIGRPHGKRFDWGSMRRSYIRFFERLGHTPVERYPILARWRDDIYYTIATIACFQPWVTSGIAPPPANPLVISQPCIRFNDLDNVGKTGRHFSAFEMMAHHAFNSREQHIYFKDETLEYAYQWFTEGMGVPPEKLIFKDSWWEGGGNAGPCHECVVEGLELCTLVHMGYEGPGPDGTYREIPLKVVDTGYGLERAVWLSQGSPTAYDAVMPGVVEYVRGLAGVTRVDPEILAEYSKAAGVLDVETEGWHGLKKKILGVVAGRTGSDAAEIEEMITPYEAIYAITDHSRAICYMLGDGAVPSNAREGYLVRLLIRRLIRFLRSLGLEEEGVLQKVVKKQFDTVKVLFPEIKDREDEIFEMVDLEEHRYRESIVKGYKVVRKTVKKLREKGEKTIPLDELKNLYNTHGVLPEEVQRFVGTEMVVNIPENFGALVAMEHSTPIRPIEKHQGELEEKAGKLSHIPKTEILFYDKPGQKSFSATVLHAEGNLLVLDRTLFYPEGGGQPADQGKIGSGGRNVRVVDVQKVGDKIFHITDNPSCEKLFTRNEKVTGVVDWDRRKKHCQHHTATHILIGACRKLLGDHIWQTGSQISEERARLDLTHHKNLTREELNKIERVANRVVQATLPVRSEMMSRTLAEKTYGFRLYQGGAVPGAEIRVLS